MTNQKKLLKLAKNLNSFSFDDLLILSEENEAFIRLFIEEALMHGSIKRNTNGQYLFIRTNAEQVKPVDDCTKAKSGKSKRLPTKSFKDAAICFLRSDYCKRLKPSTFVSYKGYINNQLIPFFNRTRLSAINEDKVVAFMQKLAGEGLSMTTVNKYIDVLIIILNMYNPRNKITNDIKFNNERNYYNDIQILKPSEIKKLLQSTKKHYPDFYPLLLTAISTGMTRGELLGLTWEDINIRQKKIRVNKSQFKNKLVIHTTKNSIRNIDISDELITELKDWREVCPKGEENLVFPNSEGGIQDPDNLIKRRFMPAVHKSKIPKICFLNLRDTYASLLIKQNLPLTYIQEQLGHSSPQVTAERYKFLLEQNQIPKKNVLEGVL